MKPFSDYVVYVDESGDHSLTSIDQTYPVFVLAFCVFRKADYIQSIVPAIQGFKFRQFGHDMVVLHERELRRQEPPFVFLKSESKRAAFLAEINALIEVAPFTVIASAIRKDRLAKRYSEPLSPYDIAMLFCLERLNRLLTEAGQQGKRTTVVFECRGKQEDKELELAFRRICDRGGMQGPMPDLDIVFAHKQVNSTGLQIADLIARPIGLKTLRPDQPNRAYEIIDGKFRRSSSGKVDGWGLKIFP
ncbi:MAG: DUF3800 domain-containing protein [Reyranella sp.]